MASSFTTMEDAWKMFSRPEVFVPAVILSLFLGYIYLWRTPPDLAKLRILNSLPDEWFPYLRALYRNTLGLKNTLYLHHAHHKEETVRIPILGPGRLVLLPSSQRKWLLGQPESILSMHQQTDQHFQFDYGTIYPTRDHQQVHIGLVTTKLTSQIGNLIPRLAEELDLALAKHWGGEGPSAEEEWREVCVYDTLRVVIGQAINRIFIGESLCRNREMLDAAVAYAQCIPVSAQLLILFPKPLRRLVAPLITLPNRWLERKWFKLTVPEVRERLRSRARQQSSDSKENAGSSAAGSGTAAQNDFLEWLIAHGEASGDPYLLDPEVMAARILLLNAFALHTTAFAVTHMVLDLVGGSGAERGARVAAELRQEVRDVLASHGDDGEWNKRALARLEKLDSAFRESQRVNTVLSVGPLRIVSAREGVETPSGARVPRGYQVGIPAYSIHFDEDIWGADAGQFRPFRFSDKRREVDAQAAPDHLQRARQAWATTSPEYLSFGAGRNSCPGRFFAAGLLKVLMANILLKYDFEFQEERPKNVWFGTNHLPPTDAKIRIRRRK